MWATDPATRCVWIWFLLMADPEGFVVGTVPGVAQQAGVTLDQAKAAIALLENPDPYSSTPEFEGRRVIKVERGWHIVNFVAYRERAKAEAEKARKRAWVKQKRAKQLELPFPDVDTGRHVDGSSETVDAPKPKPKPTPKPKEEDPDPPLPPAARFEPFDAPIVSVRRTFHDLDGLDETGLEDEAVMAGMSREWFKERLACARNLTIGGAGGVRDQREWVRQQFGKWKTWEEEARAKNAQRSAANAPRSGSRAPFVRVEPIAPEPKHEAFARRHGLDLDAILQGVLSDYPESIPSFSRLGVLGERLTVAAKQKREGHAVTGKLTRAESEAWGLVPPGGSIPELEKGAAA
jgi:hypothetical protein